MHGRSIAWLAATLAIGLTMLPDAASAAGNAKEPTVGISRHRLNCHQVSAAGYALCAVAFDVNVSAGDPKELDSYVYCRLLYNVRYTDNARILYRKATELANSVPLSNGQGNTEFLIRVRADPRHGPVKAVLVDDIQCTAHR